MLLCLVLNQILSIVLLYNDVFWSLILDQWPRVKHVTPYAELTQIHSVEALKDPIHFQDVRVPWLGVIIIILFNELTLGLSLKSLMDVTQTDFRT